MIKILHISIDKVPYDAEKTCLPRIQDSNPRLDTRAHIFLNLFQILTIDYAPKRKTQGLPCILYFFIWTTVKDTLTGQPLWWLPRWTWNLYPQPKLVCYGMSPPCCGAAICPLRLLDGVQHLKKIPASVVPQPQISLHVGSTWDSAHAVCECASNSVKIEQNAHGAEGNKDFLLTTVTDYWKM
jgi:hypothetical protein